MVYLSAGNHHPGADQAQCSATMLIGHNVLLTRPCQTNDLIF